MPSVNWRRSKRLTQILLIAGSTASIACQAQTEAIAPLCQFTEDDLIGAWWSPIESDEIVENDGRELDFALTGDVREVSEFLHHRPFGKRIWIFENCLIRVISDNGFEEHFRLEGHATAILVGNPDEAENRTMYAKLEEPAAAQ